MLWGLGTIAFVVAGVGLFIAIDGIWSSARGWLVKRGPLPPIDRRDHPLQSAPLQIR